jgi:hypothetical protein
MTTPNSKQDTASESVDVMRPVDCCSPAFLGGASMGQCVVLAASLWTSTSVLFTRDRKTCQDGASVANERFAETFDRATSPSSTCRAPVKS